MPALVLSRTVGEVVDITVGDTVIQLCPVRIGSARVRFRIEAPPHVIIDRREITNLKAMEREAEGHEARE